MCVITLCLFGPDPTRPLLALFAPRTNNLTSHKRLHGVYVVTAKLSNYLHI